MCDSRRPANGAEGEPPMCPDCGATEADGRHPGCDYVGMEPRVAVESAAWGPCQSGWTGDRCTLPLFHAGPHSND